MKIILKFIGTQNLLYIKEISLDMTNDNSISEGIYNEIKKNPSLKEKIPTPNEMNILYKGKTIDPNEKLSIYNINSDTKLNVTFKKAERDKKDENQQEHEYVIIQNNKQKATDYLKSIGYDEEIIKSIINSINKEYLVKSKPDELIEKCILFLKSYVKSKKEDDSVFEISM